MDSCSTAMRSTLSAAASSRQKRRTSAVPMRPLVNSGVPANRRDCTARASVTRAGPPSPIPASRARLELGPRRRRQFDVQIDAVHQRSGQFIPIRLHGTVAAAALPACITQVPTRTRIGSGHQRGPRRKPNRPRQNGPARLQHPLAAGATIPGWRGEIHSTRRERGRHDWPVILHRGYPERRPANPPGSRL